MSPSAPLRSARRRQSSSPRALSAALALVLTVGACGAPTKDPAGDGAADETGAPVDRGPAPAALASGVSMNQPVELDIDASIRHEPAFPAGTPVSFGSRTVAPSAEPASHGSLHAPAQTGSHG